MDTHNRGRTVFLLVMTICFCFAFVSISGDNSFHAEQEKKNPCTSDMTRSTFPLCTTSPRSKSYWDKLKTAMNQAQAYFFPPNLDFRGSEAAETIKGTVSGGEKVKQAVAKSSEKSKVTVEESAKSAAEIAGKTMQKTKDKVKKCFSEL